MTRHVGKNGIQRGGGISRNTVAIAPTSVLEPSKPLSGIQPTWDKERAKRIARNVAIGLASAAAIGGIAYGAHSIYSKYNVPINNPSIIVPHRPIVAVSSRDIPEDPNISGDDEKYEGFKQISAASLLHEYEVPPGAAEDPFGSIVDPYHSKALLHHMVSDLLHRYFTREGRDAVKAEFYINGADVLESIIDVLDNEEFRQQAHKRQYTRNDLLEFKNEVEKVITALDIEAERKRQN